MRINKVRVKIDEDIFRKIAITYEELNSTTGRNDTKMLESTEQPTPELLQAFKNLVPVATYCGELPKDWESKLSVSGLTFTWGSDDEYRVVIIAKRESSVGVPLNLSTPIRYVVCSEDSNNNMPEQYIQLLKEVHSKVIGYIKGERSQAELELE
jgi:hypothetical protein